tara:strand:- start:38 stop:484 length:447 start_codon:yes stop_codon:yes gene_type:complete
MLGENTMKITKARLKQIIKEEMENLDLDEERDFDLSPERDKAIYAHAGKACSEVHPDMTHPEFMNKLDEAEEVETEEEPEEEYMATGREKKSDAAVASGGKLGQEEFKGMLTNLLKSKKVMPADRKAVLSDMFGSVGAKIHQALLAEK